MAVQSLVDRVFDYISLTFHMLSSYFIPCTQILSVSSFLGPYNYQGGSHWPLPLCLYLQMFKQSWIGRNFIFHLPFPFAVMNDNLHKTFIPCTQILSVSSFLGPYNYQGGSHWPLPLCLYLQMFKQSWIARNFIFHLPFPVMNDNLHHLAYTVY